MSDRDPGKLPQITAPRRIAMYCYDGAQGVDVLGPMESFGLANQQFLDERLGSAPPYSLELLAPAAGPVTLSSGLQLIATRRFDAMDAPIDTLLIAGGIGDSVERQRRNAALLGWLASLPGRVRRIGSICSGALLLADAGVLDDRRATTHWMDLDALAHRRRIDVLRDVIFVRDGNVYTSAGITTGIDLALSLIEEDLGRRLALSVARRMVMFARRSGGQRQLSPMLAAQADSGQRLDALPAWLREHLDEDLGIERLADRAAMSVRAFSKNFRRAFGSSPALYVEKLRVECAKNLLDDPRVALAQVAQLSGFGNRERLRAAFLRQLGISARDYQARRAR
jgi:transcriptional regulator GlxA family with amidase domain